MYRHMWIIHDISMSRWGVVSLPHFLSNLSWGVAYTFPTLQYFMILVVLCGSMLAGPKLSFAAQCLLCLPSPTHIWLHMLICTYYVSHPPLIFHDPSSCKNLQKTFHGAQTPPVGVPWTKCRLWMKITNPNSTSWYLKSAGGTRGLTLNRTWYHLMSNNITLYSFGHMKLSCSHGTFSWGHCGQQSGTWLLPMAQGV